MYYPISLIIIVSFVAELTICIENPIIGVLTQSTITSSFKYSKPLNSSYIAASYVKAIEASGGRVVPIFTNKTTEYYKDIVNQVNGILIPGGGAKLNNTYGIGRSANEIFNIAKNINDMKDHFPILGICLGFELLLTASINGQNPLSKCSCEGVNLTLTLIPEMEEKSVLFKTMPQDIKNILLTEPVTANHHSFCMKKKNFVPKNLDKFWNPITSNKDKQNLTFISIIEAKDYPFIGLQFHPEKNAYEWKRKDPHSWSAIYSARYFFDWFINETRLNNHTFINQKTLNKNIIYNYQPTYVKSLNSSFEQVYFFDN